MKTKQYLSILAVCAMGLLSCQDDHNNFMVDDTIGLLKSGLVEVEVFDGVDDPLHVYAIKAGKGFQNAEVTLAVDNSVLEAYNEAEGTTYKELPANCYSITINTLQFTKEDYRKAFEINWNRDALKAALKAALEENSNLVIPVRMSVAKTGVQVDENRLTALLSPVVEVPTIGLDTYGFTTGLTPTRRSAEEEDVYMTVSSNFIAQHDIDVKFKVDPTLIDEYNEANGTNFKPLPEGALRFETEGWTLKKYLNSMRMKFTFVREALIPTEGSSLFGSYMIPIRIVSATSGDTEYTLREGEDFLLYTVNVVASEIDKSNWKIVSTSDNANIANDPDSKTARGSFPPENMIDGTTSKIWKSVWSVDPGLPIEIVIDLGQERDLYKLGINNVTGGSRRENNCKKGTYSASLDGENFTEIGEFSFASINVAQSQTEVGPCHARYIKLTITETIKTENHHVQLAEFNAWGE